MGGQQGTSWGTRAALRLLMMVFWGSVGCCGLACAWAESAPPLLRTASAIAFDASGNLFIADAAAHQVWEATLGGALVLVAGTGVQGYAGDGGPGVSAQLNQPQGLAFGPDGTLYIADTGNHRVRMLGSSGLISTFAGTGTAGAGGDSGKAIAAQLRGPTALAVDGDGALLICDTGNHRVRRIAAGVIGTFAGTGEQGFAGDGGPAGAARLDSPSGVAIAADGRVFLADTHNQRVRVVDTSGTIGSVVGTGVRGFGGDGGAAQMALLSSPRGLAFDSRGNLLIADEGNQRIRQVNAAGVISTLAGSGVEGASLDGAGALAAALRSPRAVATSSFGLPVFADRLNHTVREATGAPGLYQPAALAPGRSTGMTAAVGPAITYGQTENTTVSVAGAVGTPAGQVQLAEAGVPATGAALVGGSAAMGVSGLAAGLHHVTATYVGDGLNPEASASFDLPVGTASLTATATSGQVPYGAALPQLVGVVSGLLPQDVGAVEVTFGIVGGSAPSVGTYPMTAVLSGPKAANYTVAMSSTSGSLQVVKAGAAAVLGSVGQSFAGMPMALSATVAPATRGVPTGQVEFLDGTTVVATAALSGGIATTVYPAPPEGSRSLSVLYLGDGNFLPSSSPTASVSVSPLPDFAIATSGASAASTAAGGVASYSVLVSSASGPFTGAVSLSATGLPAGATVSFSPPQVVPGSGSAVVTVSVQTSAATSSAVSPIRPGAFSAGGNGGTALCLGGLCWLGWSQRRFRRGAALLSLLGAIFFLAGCGARTVGEGTGGVLAQTYTLQVMGTGTNLAGRVVTHGTALTLTVQQ